MNSESATPKHKRQKAEEHIIQLETKLTETEKIADTYLKQLMYTKADLENLQKQTQRRIEEGIERANTRILSQLLPITDELGIIVTNSNGNEKMTQGVAMIHMKLLKFLEEEGVKPIEAVGHMFDPYKHEAVLEMETSTQPAGCVVEEIRQGYMWRDKVLRASMVKVAKAPSEKEN